MYYYMFKASKPLKDKPDKTVNGYDIDYYEDVPNIDEAMEKEDAYQQASNQYDFDNYDDKEARDYIDEINEDSKDFEDCLLLNNIVGYYARTKAAKKFNKGRDTDELKNEVGWINEYYFGLDVKPRHYGGPPIEPNILKYESQSSYDEPWDFTRDNWSAEIKTSSKHSIGGSTYPDRLYYVQVSKFKNPPTERFDIWWAEIDSYQRTFLNRSSPYEWKYFEMSNSEWKDYKIIEGKGLFHNGYKIAGYDIEQGGAQYGPQLYFFSPQYAEELNANTESNKYRSELKTFIT